VSRDKLFVRLHSYGICGSLLLWLKHFFTHRRYLTKVGNLLSDVEDLTVVLSVVQGSGIGPLMFLININKLIKVLEQYNRKVKQFADHIKLYVRVLSDIDKAML